MKNLFHDLPSLEAANWHIHPRFSPCADADMTIDNIIAFAEAAKLKTIALTDHLHRPDCNIIDNIINIKENLAGRKTKINVIVGAELSAYGIGKYSDNIEINGKIDYRLYACNHYNLNFWEQPEVSAPRAYAE
ncbi:MAG: PHP domain-containing protein, partial [Victivallaceae bacterium]|nr:PHP domain-containing protein [Victivallaceae bacterium]